MITFYTTHCPRCKVLAKKLDSKNIQYSVCEDQDKMLALGLKTAPALDVDGTIMTFEQVVKWLNDDSNGGGCAECRLN